MRNQETITWTEFKFFVDNRNASVHWIDLGNRYWIKAVDGPFTLEIVLFKNVDGSDLADFEDNYKNESNNKHGNFNFTDEGRLKVQDVGTIDSGFRISSSFVSSALSQTYTDYLVLEGKGTLNGFKIKTSNEDVNIKLIIDDETSFEIRMQDVHNFTYHDYDNTSLPRFFGSPSYGEMEFFPAYPIRYSTNLKVQIKKNQSWTMNLEKQMFFYSED